MAKLFVSYSRKDSVAARKLIEAFRSIEQDVWVDWESIPPAVDWLEQIFRGIEEADAFLFLISPDSIASEVCKVEINKAAENNKRIIPIVLRDVAPKDAPESIRKLNWTYIRETDNFEEGLAKVKTAIELDLDWLEEHRRLQVRSLEWHRKKDPSLLLRGRDLRNARHMLETATSKDPPATDLQKTYILFSQKNERNRNIAWSASALALIIMAILSLIAINRSIEARTQQKFAEANAEEANIQAVYANMNREKAESNAQEANKQRSAAEEAKALAEENEKKAEAQRSAARAQIYQNRPGELYTSTLLAIDSIQRSFSDEAEEILRTNLSLLPVPVAQVAQEGNINAIEFSPKGDLFVTASADGTMCAWKVADGTKAFCTTSKQSVNDLVFTPDGELIVTGDSSGTVTVWNAEGGTIQYQYQRVKPESAASTIQLIDTKKENPQDHTILGVGVRNVNLRPGTTQQLAIAYDDGKIPVIDLRTGKLSSPLEIGGRPHVSAISPSGTFLAAGSENGTVTIWNLSDRKSKIISNVRHRNGVLAMAFSPNRRTIATAGKDNTAVIIDLRTGAELWRLLNQNWVRDLAFSPDGSWLVTVSDDHRIRIWDMETGKERIGMQQDGIVTQVTVSSNGQWIATTGEDKTVRVWDTTTGAEIFQIPLGASGSVLAFSADSKYLVSTNERGAIDIWDISVMAVPAKTLQFNGIVRNVQYSPSGDRLAVSDENRVWLLNPDPLSNPLARPTGSPVATLKGQVRNLVFSPDAKRLGILSEENEVAVYNTETNKSTPVRVSTQVQSISFSSDNQQLITSDTDGNTQAWNPLNGTALDSSVEGVASDPVITGRSLLRVFSADGSLTASSDSSGRITISKYDNGQYVDLSSFVKDQAVSLAFNPDNSILAVGTAQNVSLIDVATGKEIARIAHSDAVNGVSFSADGIYLVTASSKVLQFWEMEKIHYVKSDELLPTACSRLIQNFDTSQWTTFFGSEKYKTLCDNLPVPQE